MKSDKLKPGPGYTLYPTLADCMAYLAKHGFVRTWPELNNTQNGYRFMHNDKLIACPLQIQAGVGRGQWKINVHEHGGDPQGFYMKED